MIYTKDNVKNLKELAEQSGKGVRLYYHLGDCENKFSTKFENASWCLCEFMCKNTEEEVLAAINHWMNI